MHSLFNYALFVFISLLISYEKHLLLWYGGICSVAALLRTSLGLRQQYKSRRARVALCQEAYPYKCKHLTEGLLTQTPHFRAAPAFVLLCAEAEGFEPPERCRSISITYTIGSKNGRKYVTSLVAITKDTIISPIIIKSLGLFQPDFAGL